MTSRAIDHALKGCWEVRAGSQFVFHVPDIGEASDRFIAELGKQLSADFPEREGHRIDIRHRDWSIKGD